MEDHLGSPLFLQNFLLQGIIEEISHPLPMQLSWISESHHKLVDFLRVHHLNVIFQQTLPIVDAPIASLIAFEIGDEGAVAVAGCNISFVGKFHVCFKFLIQNWVVNILDLHIVD